MSSIPMFAGRRDESQGLVEYALILVLVAVVVIAVLSLLGPEVNSVFCTVTAALSGASDCNVTGVISSCSPTVSGGNVYLEAVISASATVDTVEFCVNGSSCNTESIYKYCLGGGDSSCNPNVIASGSVITAEAWSGGELVGTCSVTID